MIVIKPPKVVLNATEEFTVFAAGSIEMGKARNWQEELAEQVSDVDGYLLNPRRDDWDSSWEQDISNKFFKDQVEWELKALEEASLIVMYLQPGTMSPISLLELGKFAKPEKLFVCCPKGFWRKGNVDIFCKRYKIFNTDNFDQLSSVIRTFKDN